MKLQRKMKLTFRSWVWILPVIILGVLLFLILPSKSTHQIAGQNLLTDGDFKLFSADGSGAWYEDAYVNRASYTTYDFLTDKDGSVIAHISNKLPNDARFAQIVDVLPESLYCLEGDIRADAEGGLGANLSIEGPYVFSESVYDSTEWTHVRLYGRTAPDQRTVTVFARLGGYSGESTGEAWFRDLNLTEVEAVPEGYTAYDWFTRSYDTYSDGEETESGPLSHAMLMITALILYGVLVYITLHKADRKRTLEAGPLLALAVFAGALMLRVLVAVCVHGYDVDVGDFCGWATQVAVNAYCKNVQRQ